ncbi:unnamed protein product [Hymenolepis diminuta]|uniref:Uncharacterized protein n=1 Tax=Hymenolepis diminuta TaxID=6216 RepID=A0A564Y1Y3_HYMDI|nr:unnamed protein product [Hymenolepis diminuta]
MNTLPQRQYALIGTVTPPSKRAVLDVLQPQRKSNRQNHKNRLHRHPHSFELPTDRSIHFLLRCWPNSTLLKIQTH